MATSGSTPAASISPPPTKKRKANSNISEKAVHSFFTPASKKEPDQITWAIINDSLLVGRHKPIAQGSTQGKDGVHATPRRKIAAFDLDSTLIQTSSGNIFGKDATDWRWWDPVVPGTLKQLYADGYSICILSNQGSVSVRQDPKSKTVKSDQRSLTIFKTKVTAILSHFDFPILLLAATARDKYRKPRAGMWEELLEELDLDGQQGPDLGSCFFVGDAGGRAARNNARADHSCSDRDLAANVGITFKTPEEFFLEEETLPFTRLFEPMDHLAIVTSVATKVQPIVFEKKDPLDIVITCGSPASGKSTFYWTQLKALGYERVNQDLLKTRDRCVKVAETMLAEKTSVAIDNTNADPSTRAVWIDLAKKHEVPIRCVYFTAPAKLCEHNDTVRALAGATFNPEKRTILPHSAFAGFASRFKEPQITEGFADIIKVDFEFHGDDERRKLWSRYWI